MTIQDDDTMRLIRGTLQIINNLLWKRIEKVEKYKGFHILIDCDNHNAGFSINFKYPVFAITVFYITAGILFIPYDKQTAIQNWCTFRDVVYKKEGSRDEKNSERRQTSRP